MCLRAPWIWVPEDKERLMYKRLVDEYQKWSKNLWAFIHVKDVAKAIALSIDANGSQSHQSFFITADDNWTGRDSRELATRAFPETRILKPDFTGSSSFISSNKAKTELKFFPRYRTSDIFA
jgi:nucleoside-diphosphate-sugar epimerase